MKKVVLFSFESNDYYYDELHINGKRVESCGPLCECPEDAIIGRSLISCGDIMSRMKQVYADVITNNEEYKFIELEKSPDDLTKEEYEKIWQD